ncbi:MAG: precorrin-2 C(20)-methyltransferase [Candidatus Polarisedimenticolaceae bacterium]|nr:precorrin-2 C(20)-methyltransferase [Candidatus Polarisedimenticolaceae bacterium]
MNGKLYGVSVGPGDPGMITRRAWELLQCGAHWTYPIRNEKSDSYALDVVRRSGLALPENHTALIFPMTHDKEKLTSYWLRAAESVLSILRRGEDVLFLVVGDASTYATFSHLARTVSSIDEAIEIQTIAGVSSFNAAAADLQMPLADTDDTLAIVPAAYGVEMLDRLLADFDTLVLLKVNSVLDQIIDQLEARDILKDSAFIERAGMPEERIVRDVAQLRGEKVNYLSLLLVRNRHRIRGPKVRGCRKKKQ